jgi:hypothetical protein
MFLSGNRNLILSVFQLIYFQMKKETLIDSEGLTLKSWIKLVLNPTRDKLFVDYQFPTDDMRNEFIQKILLSFLITSGSFKSDEYALSGILQQIRNSPKKAKKMIEENMHCKRLIKWLSSRGKDMPWEGVT